MALLRDASHARQEAFRNLLASGLTGAIAMSLTNPLDVLKARWQVMPSGGGGMGAVTQRIVAREGRLLAMAARGGPPNLPQARATDACARGRAGARRGGPAAHTRQWGGFNALLTARARVGEDVWDLMFCKATSTEPLCHSFWSQGYGIDARRRPR